MVITTNGEAYQFNALTKRMNKIPADKLTIHELLTIYRVQKQMFDGKKSMPISLYTPPEKDKGRWNGRLTDIAMTYVAKTDKTALLEALCHADDESDFKQARDVSDKKLKPREMVKVTFEKPLRLIDVTALLPKLLLSLEDLVGDNCYAITQTLADTLYAKFGKDFDGIIYTSRWSGQPLDCAAIWSHPPIESSTQTELVKYENGDKDVYDILCDDLGFYLT
ncbi:TPA: RES family NAD+ phosphorylase [Photobacterium damselae]